MAQSYDIVADASPRAVTLRRFFLNVFLWMGIGLAVTGVSSLWISHDQGVMNALFHLQEVMRNGKTTMQPTMSLWWWLATLSQLGMVFILSGTKVSRFGKSAGYLFFGAFAFLNGITLAPALYAYTDASVATTFFAAAATFGSCALFGHITKINLRPWGTFFLISLIGLIVVMIVNLFIQSNAASYVISAAGILLFAGLTAYDMQRLETLYDELGGGEDLVIYGALTLYLDFMNLLLFFLRFLGVRKD